MHNEFDSCRPSSEEPFKVLTDELQIIQELVPRLPINPEETFEVPISYGLQRDNDKLLKDQKQ